MHKNIDTIIVPCRDTKDNEKMLNNGYWAGVKIAKAKIDKLTYIAIYHTAPVSAVTECYKIIQPLEKWSVDNKKYKINFEKKPYKINTVKYNRTNNDPILRCSRYTQLGKLEKASSLKDLF